MTRPTSLFSWSSTAVGRSRGIELMAYPNKRSCISGMVIMVASVRRSRLSCRNSLSSMAPVRRQKPKVTMPNALMDMRSWACAH